MRKGPGLSALSRHSAYSSSYSTLSSSISQATLESLQTSLESFREMLIEFSIKHKKDIKDDPAFRFQFQKMCSALNIDPLIASSASSSKTASGIGGLWGLLGIDEFEYELAVQLVDIAVSSRPSNGGLIKIQDLIMRIEKLRNGGTVKPKPTNTNGGKGNGNTTTVISHTNTISEQDIIRSLKLLEPLKSGYKLNTIGGVKYIRTIPNELNTDQSILLSIAIASGGRLTQREIKGQTSWSDDRIRLGLVDCVMDQGLGWVDEQSHSVSVSNLAGLGNASEVRGDVWIIAATNFEDPSIS
ncbi:uncharacterized protein I303_106699 [Kwoniella dejecticola CBS 10117]|uniref:ESCRT-II complex subunit VPS22 n=1 Tax=Kwoniella dejecticola CBS 10117 TaxID=1296121 RepID=A0A1A5ZTZ0_9TREE|nr:uncharacterized protein I303_08659 [Kwoniella dejecticola CBS 10117]OBR81273.1 hypothetical protein I303_08659 [Kwoniella dejecticola CBS 10117]